MRSSLFAVVLVGSLSGVLGSAPAAGQGCTTGTWAAVAPINTARSRTAVAYDAVTGHFFLAGGEATGGNRAIPIEEYDPVANTWTNRANLLTGVSNSGAAAVGGFVYVPGGWDGATGLSVLQRYDPGTNAVTTLTAMPAGNAAHAVTARGTFIHVLGGSSTGAAGTTHFVYDTVAGTWATAAALPVAVQYPAAASDGTLVYVLGGNTANVTNVQVYNPGTNSWSAGTPMNVGRGGPAAFFDGSFLWALGGGWTTYLNSTEYSSGGAWTGGPVLTAGGRTIGAAYGGGRAIKAGGWNGGYMNVAESITCASCTLTAPAPVAVNTDPGACTAVVAYTVGTSGSCGTVTCSPPSGSAFPLGQTTVDCTSTSGPTTSFTVTVSDAEPPVLTCPDVNATGAGGATVVFSPTALDNCSGATPVTCVPPSGSFFPVGATTVDCSSLDGASNEGVCSFTATVISQSVLEIPTLSPTGLGGLSLLLAGGAIALLRRRRR